MDPFSSGVVLLVVPDASWPAGGNSVTAERIRRQVLPLGVRAEVVPLAEMESRTRDGDVALLHALNVRTTGPHVARVAKGLGRPFVVTFSGTDISHDLKDPGGLEVMRQVVDEASGLLVFHPSALRSVAVAFPEAFTRIHVVWPGVEPLSGVRDRGRWGIRDDEIAFLLPAGLRGLKRPFFALDPLERLRTSHPNIRLLITGPLVEPGYDKEMEARLQGRPWVTWLGGVPREEMGSLLLSADIVLNTSISEGLSNAVTEAMSLGRPLLAADNPGNREALGFPGPGYHEPTGILFASEAAFIEGARRLIESADLRRSLGEAAKRRADAAFDRGREAGEHLALWKAATARHRLAVSRR